MTSPEVLWQPDAEAVAKAPITHYQSYVASATGETFDDYAALHRWSIDHPEVFWRSIWEFCELIGEGVLEPAAMNLNQFPGTQWFPGLKLNFAENLLRHRDNRPALIARFETADRRVLTYTELFSEVEKLASAFRAEGLGVGDRVAAFMPNSIETVVAMLATTSIGAIWSSCSPDFGVAGATDRFGQIEPKLLIAVDAYRYNGKIIDCHNKLQSIREQLTSLEATIIAPFFSSPHRHKLLETEDVFSYDDYLIKHPVTPLEFERFPFDHPIYINFSSGTTGSPKCIVHGAGGTLLQHQKEHVLHTGLTRDDTFFFHTTCGWMMWNWLISGLACGCPIVLFDGSPLAGSARVLVDLIDEENISVFGVSARYLASLEQAGVKPISSHKLERLRTILSTGSPLNKSGFDYVYRDFKSNVNLASISGGTDIISCFLLGNPTLPVVNGEIQCKGLGMAVEFWQLDQPCSVGETGELVCLKPFPSTPVGFWHDPENKRFLASYFEQNPGIWTHGDYGELTPSGGAIIHGRSDAVLNPGGVRIGTAEIYRQVEKIASVEETIAVGQIWSGDERVILFVRLQDGLKLDSILVEQIKQVIQQNTTRRHVPEKIIQVADIPRTLSGKIVEVAVRDVINGRPVVNRSSLANPESLELYKDLQELQT
jgi:acetoacetyl-CoA synthetase